MLRLTCIHQSLTAIVSPITLPQHSVAIPMCNLNIAHSDKIRLGFHVFFIFMHTWGSLETNPPASYIKSEFIILAAYSYE